MPNVRLIKHEVIPGCGSFEVRFDDGRPSVYFYFEDLPGRRLRPDLVDGKTALEQSKAFAGVVSASFPSHQQVDSYEYNNGDDEG